MRLLANSVGLALFTAVFCFDSAIAWGQKGTAEALVHDNYPGYHLLRLGERDADTRAFLLKHFKDSDPSVLRADFDGDGNPDFATLLKSDTSGAAKLVVLLCDTPKGCRGVRELDITGYSEGAYLSRLPVGARVAESEAVEGKNGSPPVKLTNVGIQLVFFEKGKVALYYDKKLKKIVDVGTSD